MARGRTGSRAVTRELMARHLSAESARITGRARTGQVERILNKMWEERAPGKNPGAPSWLDWARGEMSAARGTFDGLPWFFLAMGKYFETSGSWCDALEWYDIAREQAKKSGDLSISFDALLCLGHLRAKRGERGEAEALYRSVIDEAGGRHDQEILLRARAGMGALRFDEGRFGEAGKAFRKNLRIAERIGEQAWRAHMLNDIGAVQSAAGRPGQALSSFRASLEIDRAREYSRGIARSLHNVGAAQLERGVFVAAGASFQKSLEVSRTLGWEELVVMNILGRAEVLHLVSENETAHALAEEALERAAGLGDPFSGIEAGRIAALALHGLGSEKDALGMLEDTIAEAKCFGAPLELAKALEARVRILLDEGRPAGAALELAKVEELYESLELRAKAHRAASLLRRIGGRGS
jgi:tetratricopeptide (TPR) repeat protein